MIHCKNWFCARSNNNNYAEVLFGDSKTSTQTTVTNANSTATADTTPSSATSTLIRQQQPTANGKINATGTLNANNTTAHHATMHNSIASPPTAASVAAAAATAGSSNVSNSSSGLVGANANAVGSGSHVVTFLDDVPSGSNGVVNTTTRLMNNTDLQQQQQQQQHFYDHHTSDDLEALDTDEFLANHVVSSAMLCDDTLPTSKNCYRLVVLG